MFSHPNNPSVRECQHVPGFHLLQTDFPLIILENGPSSFGEIVSSPIDFPEILGCVLQLPCHTSSAFHAFWLIISKFVAKYRKQFLTKITKLFSFNLDKNSQLRVCPWQTLEWSMLGSQ